MDIQQQEKESLATYIHRLKAKTRRCSFTNDAATIRIFVKGLKIAHSLATHIYEKGPQTLTDTISEKNKCCTTAHGNDHPTLHSYEVLNEPGHITQNSPHIRCYECDEYGHIVMDCPHRIPPSGTPMTHHKSHKSHHARSNLRHHLEDRDR